MNRVKIELPDNFSFSTRIVIRITDINYGNHVGNQVFLELMHEARVRFLQQYSYTELNCEGVALIMADMAIEFKSELFYAEEVEVNVMADTIGRSGFDLLYKITTIRQGNSILIAKAKTAMVGYNYGLKKVAALPEKAKAILLG